MTKSNPDADIKPSSNSQSSMDISGSLRPIIATLILGFGTVVGGVFSGYFQARWSAQLEDKRFQASLINEALKSDTLEERGQNLKFLADTNLIFDRRIQDGIRKSIESGNLPQLIIKSGAQPDGSAIFPPEFVGIYGEFDASGLAKRVSQALNTAGILGIEVSQNGNTVVLQYSSGTENAIIEKAKEIASKVDGAANVIAKPM